MANSPEKYSIFESAGDPSKELMGTAVVESLKKADPERKIVVVTLFPDIWLHNPNVYRVYKMGSMSYFYDDFVKDKDTLIYRNDPYATSDYAYDEKHIIDIWCDLCGVPRANSMPSLHFTWREKEATSKLTASPLPLFFIQPFSSSDPQLPFYWHKDLPLPVIEQVVAKMNAKGYQTVQIREGHHPQIAGTTSLALNLRQTLCALSYSKKRLFVDSYAAQAAAALNLRSVVTYTTTFPDTTGYPIHASIEAFSHLNTKGKKGHEKLIEFVGSFKEGYDITGAKRLSPYPLDALFDADSIIQALES